MMEEQPEYADSEMGEGTEGYSGFEICIRCDADGSLSVGVEEDSTPQTEGLEGDEDKSGYKPAASIREALTMALDIYRSREGKSAEAESDDSFDSAFTKTRGGMA
jgi:hypothetical protein